MTDQTDQLVPRWLLITGILSCTVILLSVTGLIVALYLGY